MERVLYQFPLSPFSRRTRLALAHKGLPVELRDGRTSPELVDEARALVPLRTFPVLVEPDGRALADSNAIARYLDAAYPEAPTLWPRRDAFEILEVATFVDVALDALINTATRYFGARGDAAWPAIQAEMVLRAQTALDALAARVAKLDRHTIGGGGWSGADMWLYTAVTWLASLPRRAADPNAPANVKQLMTLGFTVPAPLVAWAEKHASRPDVMLHG